MNYSYIEFFTEKDLKKYSRKINKYYRNRDR